MLRRSKISFTKLPNPSICYNFTQQISRANCGNAWQLITPILQTSIRCINNNDANNNINDEQQKREMSEQQKRKSFEQHKREILYRQYSRKLDVVALLMVEMFVHIISGVIVGGVAILAFFIFCIFIAFLFVQIHYIFNPNDR